MSLFLIDGSTRVYESSSSPPADGPLLVFLANESDSGLPQQMTMAQAFDDPSFAGWFVIVPPLGASTIEGLASALAASTAFPPAAATGLAWTSYDGTAVETPQLLPLGPGSSDGSVVNGTFPLGVGPYGIRMQDGCPVTPLYDDADDILQLEIASPPMPGFPAPNGPACTIPFSGESAFCLVAQGLIGDPTASPGTGFDISIRFFVPGPSGGQTSVDFPLFAPFATGEQLVANLTLDPLTNWWTPDGPLPMRTAYDLMPITVTLVQNGAAWTLSPGAAAPFATNLSTVYGDTISITPLGASLVPEPLPTDPAGWYLVPSGMFAIATAGTVAQWLPGLSGTEFIEVFPGTTVLVFTPHQPAFAPQFPLSASNNSAATASPLLVSSTEEIAGPFLTAWCSLLPDALSVGPFPPMPRYFAQPLNAPLFGQGQVDGVLPIFSPLVGNASGEAIFPIAPYAGVSAAFDYPTFEQQILAPTRQGILAAAAGNGAPAQEQAIPATATATQTTTPQGLLVTVDGTQWSSLILASNIAPDGTVQTLQIETVSDTLRAALQSTNLFLVITESAPVASLQGVITIAGWPFDISVGSSPPDYANVLIFKFCSGALTDLASNLSAWTNPGAFNGDPGDVQEWLQGYLADAAVAEAGTPELANFNAIVNSADWNGILALNVGVSLASLPPDLAGLVAGINASLFFGHHLGVTATPVTQSGGSLAMPATSSLFALIDYVSQGAPTVTNASGFSFRVMTLTAVFQNSQIVAFDSQIVLGVATLFGESVQLFTPPSTPPILQNAIELAGHLETRGAVTVYVFTGIAPAVFATPQSTVLNYIAVTGSEFNTLQPPSAANGETFVAQFRLAGTLNFQSVPGLDVFSFGDPPGTLETAAPVTPDGLAFANLFVDMTFQDSGPNPTPAFTVDLSALSLDASMTAPRPNSLYAGLPLSVGTILSSANGTTSGWLPVVGESLTTTGVQPIDPSNWLAITNVLNLGTMGALANHASFNASLIVLWTPGGTSPQVSLMMQLPGTAPGKTTLSLQNVLKLNVGQIVIPAVSASEALQISFTNIGLSLFGLTLPTGAVVDLALAGGSEAGGGSLGWYAAFARSGGGS
jgi:hypothetical protein